jgi:hypothetical protein
MMTIEQTKQFIAGEIARIERENPVGELRPWCREACPAAGEHWGRVQQRIALEGRDLSRACLKGLDIAAPERSEAQKTASAAAGRRMAMAKAS